MILLNKNLVSEVMRSDPVDLVLDWFGSEVGADFYLPATVKAKLRLRVFLLPEGKRRNGLASALKAMIEEDFAGRILPFESLAANSCAIIAAPRR